MKLYTLLYINDQEKNSPNISTSSYPNQLTVYLQCIANLNKSLIDTNFTLSIITNNSKLLTRVDFIEDIDIIEITFSLEVPSGIDFYAAHFKIDVFKYFSTLTDPYVGLIDSDMLCINNVPTSLKHAIDNKIALYYNVTDQVGPAHDYELIVAEKQLVSETNKVGLWSGGEFIMGSPDFFKLLYQEIMIVKEQYFNKWQRLHHRSDEFLTSVAIENMLLKHVYTLVDAGQLNIISRYWSIETLHHQKPLAAYLSSFLLHLPADKALLSEAYKQKQSPKQFIQAYSLQERRRKNVFLKTKNRLMNYIQRRFYPAPKT